ncbi:MAG: cytochrome-c oxidase, cbb3-type subunit II, partial [Bdellovibrionaceae bacterium]|nr:cytochrome-c oxidase, cbb3-type subunit II [Pseudobdellovibrionaceae bacterium]
VIKFFVAALTAYGMATFEGPLLSIKTVSALGHYTDWIVGHVHGGALGWNGMLSFGMAYYMIPRLWKTELYSKKLAEWHFWLALLGVLLYYISMVSAGITQGMMWMALNPEGKLVYPDFVETVSRIVPLYWVRAIGGLFFLTGFVLMVYNFIMSVRGKQPENSEVVVPKRAVVFATQKEGEGHRRLEGLGTIFSVLTLVAVGSGSVISIYPILNLNQYVHNDKVTEPWTPLELAGRDIYVREGCYTCHSQQIRKLSFDVMRYGAPSTIEESMWDRPHQWGSKRTGPDLSRIGKKYPDLWHYRHMLDPRAITSQSIMPAYPWLVANKTDFIALRKKISVLKFLGTPYSDEVVANPDIIAQKEAKVIADRLAAEGAPQGLESQEIVALIAYLQAMGQKPVLATEAQQGGQ